MLKCRFCSTPETLNALAPRDRSSEAWCETPEREQTGCFQIAP